MDLLASFSIVLDNSDELYIWAYLPLECVINYDIYFPYYLWHQTEHTMQACAFVCWLFIRCMCNIFFYFESAMFFSSNSRLLCLCVILCRFFFWNVFFSASSFYVLAFDTVCVLYWYTKSFLYSHILLHVWVGLWCICTFVLLPFYVLNWHTFRASAVFVLL